MTSAVSGLSDLSQNSEAAGFSINAEESHALCLSAKEIMADEPALAESTLVEALLLRPSNMLAYQLLSQIYQAAGRLDDAALCRKGLLPAGCLSGYGDADSECVVDSASADSVQKLTLFPADSINLPRPVNINQSGQSALPSYFDAACIESKPCFIDCIVDGVLWHDSFHSRVFNARGEELKEHTKADSQLIDLLMSKHEPLNLAGRVFFVGARGAHNFYHWMADIAPKPGVLRRAGFRFQGDDRFVVPFAKQGFVAQILSQFGVKQSQLYETENNSTYLRAEELIVPYVDNKMGLTMGRWVPQVMRENFLPNDRIAGNRRLFIIRDSLTSDGRQIKNQRQLQQLLQQYGFECVALEKLPLVQQAILFAEAEIVLAAHGAALVNLMFCSKGTKVVELYAGHLAPCYRAISALCDLEYNLVYCGNKDSATETQQQQTQAARRSGNLTVPLAELEVLLKKLLLNSSSS